MGFGGTRHSVESIVVPVTADRLARIFGETVGLGDADRAGVGEKLNALVAVGREAWPRVAIAPEDFVAHLARHADGLAFLEVVHASNLYLASAVLRHDRAALAYFEDHFMARVSDFVLRVRVGRDVVEDMKQKLRERLILGRLAEAEGEKIKPKIAEYSGKGALGGWLRVAAVRTALNHLRSVTPTEEVREEIAHGTNTSSRTSKSTLRTC